MIVEVLGVIEKTSNSSDSYLEMLETIKAAGIVSFVDQDGRVSIKYLSRQSKVGKLIYTEGRRRQICYWK